MVSGAAVALAFVAAALLGAAALAAALRLLHAFGHAHPTERGNHKAPTPQIGGIALVPVWCAVLLAASLGWVEVPVFTEPSFLAAMLLLTATGIVDDQRHLGAAIKLTAQFAAALLAAHAFYGLVETAGLPVLPVLAIAVVALVAITNLTNFIDGLDLMAASTVGIPAAGFAAIAVLGLVTEAFALPAAALAGVMAAFAFFNWPPARLFLGDGGSQPFGLLLGTMAVVAALQANLFAGLLVPAYILLDGIFTLIRRSLGGEPFWKPHSKHVYQRSYRGGRSVLQVIGFVAGFGVLAAIATWLAASASPVPAAAVFLAVCILWALLARLMTRARG